MQKYRCHKVVEAAKIIGFRATDEGLELITRDGAVAWTRDGSRPPEDMVGGYFVRYEDGYISWSPAEVFESGYALASLDPKDGALPVAGYKPQTQEKVDLVNGFKADEERLLRKLDDLQAATRKGPNDSGPNPYDGRWLAIGRTALEQAFMAINRAVFQPGRSALPEERA